MKRLLLIFIIGILMTGFTAALSIPGLIEDPSKQQLQSYADKYNENIDDVPGFVKTIVGDQKINLHYENFTYGLETEDMKVENVTAPHDNSSLEIWVEKEDIEEIAEANNSKKKLKQKLDNDEIRYEEKGIINKVKFGIAETALDIGVF